MWNVAVIKEILDLFLNGLDRLWFYTKQYFSKRFIEMEGKWKLFNKINICTYVFIYIYDVFSEGGAYSTFDNFAAICA